jgi:hypothetical protein
MNPMMSYENNLHANAETYLKSILDPWNYVAGIPDEDMTTSVNKKIIMSRTVKAQASGGGMFLITPHNKRVSPIQHYVEKDGRYYWRETLSYAEDLSQNFVLSRLSSAGFKISSSTRSGGTIDLAGIFNSVQYQDLPDLKTLTFEEVPAYSRNDVDVIAGLDVEEGVVTLTQPNSSHTYGVIETATRHQSTANLSWDAETNITVNPGQGWVPTPAVVTPSSSRVFLSSNITDATHLLPKNMTGKFRLRLEFTFEFDTTTTLVSVSAGPAYQVIDAADTVTVKEAFGFWQISQPQSTFNTHTLEFDPTNSPNYEEYADVDYLFVDMSSVGGNATITYARITVEHETYLTPGRSGPGSIVAYAGVTPTQELTVSGASVFQVVPDADLSRQIPTSHTPFPSPFGLAMVESYVGNFGRHGGKMLWPSSDYRMFQKSSLFNDMTRMDKVATASGFTDFFKKLWGYVKPAIVSYAPIVGGALGGPEGALLGQGVSAITRAYGSNRRPGIGSIGRASNFEEDQEDPLLEDEKSEQDFEHDRTVRGDLGSPRTESVVGRASGLGSAPFINALERVKKNYRIQEITTLDTIDESMVSLDTALTTMSREYKSKGIESVGIEAANAFAYVEGEGSVVSAGQGVAYFTPEMVTVEGSKVFAVTGTQMEIMLTVMPVPTQQVVDSVIAAMSSFAVVVGVPLKGSIFIKTPVELHGYSASFAVFETLLGHSHTSILTGAWCDVGDNNVEAFIPGDLELKEQEAIRSNKMLYVTAELEDLTGDHLTMANRQYRGVVSTPTTVEDMSQSAIYDAAVSIMDRQYREQGSNLLARRGEFIQRLQEGDEGARRIYAQAEEETKARYAQGFTMDTYVLVTDLTTPWFITALGFGKRTKFGAVVTQKQKLSLQSQKKANVMQAIEDLDYDERIQWKTGGSAGTFTVLQLMEYPDDNAITDGNGDSAMQKLKDLAEKPRTLEQRDKSLRKLANMVAMIQLRERAKTGNKRNAGEVTAKAKRKQATRMGRQKFVVRKPLLKQEFGGMVKSTKYEYNDDEDDGDEWGV